MGRFRISERSFEWRCEMAREATKSVQVAIFEKELLALLAGATDETLKKFAQRVARVAKGLTRWGMGSFCVRASDMLDTALNRMIEFEEDIIPVLDEDGRILGDLRLSEVLLKTLEMSTEQEETHGSPAVDPALVPAGVA